MTSPFFPNKTIQKMSDIGVSEYEVLDVFNNGEYTTKSDGTKIAAKKYDYYEIGLIYDQNKSTGKWIIITVWKRPRL